MDLQADIVGRFAYHKHTSLSVYSLVDKHYFSSFMCAFY